VKPIAFHPGAAAELEDAALYYERQREGLGVAFQNAVQAAVARVQERPQTFPLYEDADGVRMCQERRFRYTVYYTELDESILVAAVAHNSRRPGYWHNRLAE
jgi:toxin ParE1/3/4